jgi:hypothetical protein
MNGLKKILFTICLCISSSGLFLDTYSVLARKESPIYTLIAQASQGYDLKKRQLAERAQKIFYIVCAVSMAICLALHFTSPGS